jgi:tRNA pseudouridine55 synthase
MNSFDRIILIDKPAGISSFGVVAKVRYALTEEKWQIIRQTQPDATRKQAKVKVGHCGTLDPFATGLLVLVSGAITRRAAEFTKLDKVYTATVRLGATSTTGDPEGEITEVETVNIPSKSDIKKIIEERFLGDVTQTPPIYSAIKINGVRAYKLARKVDSDASRFSSEDHRLGRAPSSVSSEKIGEKSRRDNLKRELSTKIPSRNITIHTLEILDYSWPTLTIRAHVSSGTYIRTLAEDIGTALGVGAYCETLRREKIGKFDIKDALTLEKFLT